jgi:hypothetical protein
MAVHFSGQVRDELPDDLRAQLKIELTKAFKELNPRRSPVNIYVPRIFSGHSPRFQEKVILAVEVTYADGYERHILKVGDRKKVEPDFKGWRQCTGKRMVASRIFAPVRLLDWKGARAAVLYRDAFTLFGPDPHDNSRYQPTMLDEAILWVVKDDEPDLLSAERALVQVFTDLGLWFYRGAKVDADAAHRFYTGHLRRKPGEDVLAAWQGNSPRRDLRRHAVWVLAGRDAPDADPVDSRARYLDPVDYVGWAVKDPGRFPKTLVGRSHGDLHARNVLVGVRRGEVQYPAVFDYGDMSDHNVLAWDFAKLETELKARLLPVIMGDGAVSSFLIERSKLRKPPQERPSAGLRPVIADRADRLATFLAFEELLDDLTESVCTSLDMGRLRPLRQPPTGIPKLDRLAAILLRVRREAATWLGFEVPGRKAAWKDELYFALGVYGLLNVRWDYSQPEQEAALVSAGVALARMPLTPSLLKDCIAGGRTPGNDYPSYRVPLAILYDLWRAKRHEEGCQFGEQVAVAVEDRKEPRSCRIVIRPEACHAVPLVGQTLLLETEVGNLHAVERVLEGLRAQAREFGDYETLARIGRMYKESGDRRWEEEAGWEGFHATRPPWLQMFDLALDVYAEAFETTGDWYVGINAATLALLTGDADRAKVYAQRVAQTCVDLLKKIKADPQAPDDRPRKKDRYWLYATEGEAALILNEPAEHFYQAALHELTPGQWGMADSSYKQACRLWKGGLGDRVEPILRMFESSDLRDYLTPGFLGRKAPGEQA